jgi:hypothetical protein
LISNSTGVDYVIWYHHNLGDTLSVLAMSFDADGNSRWGPEPLRLGVGIMNGDADPIVLHSDGSGGFVAVWERKEFNLRGVDLYAQRVDSNGVPLWTEGGVPVSTADSTQWLPSAISDGNHGSIVVWVDDRHLGPTHTHWDYDIYAARISGDGNIYPVEMQSFTGKRVGQSIYLDWVTASETNNEGFSVERSLESRDTAPAWTRIAFQPGHWTTTHSSAYRYIDTMTEAFAGATCASYRLRQRDYDGTEHLSAVARVVLDTSPVPRLFDPLPNPAYDRVGVRFAFPSASHGVLAIVDALGRIVLRAEESVWSGGMHERSFDVGRLPAGVYRVVLKSDGGVATKGLVLLR